jgi:hypothetical protein
MGRHELSPTRVVVANPELMPDSVPVRRVLSMQGFRANEILESARGLPTAPSFGHGGFCYTAFVSDVCTKKIVGWACLTHHVERESAAGTQ